MEIINITRQHPSIVYINISCIISFKYFKEIWLFNCCQGCQHTIEKKHLKISQISKIILTDLNIINISGLLGLLSSLSLINRKKVLNIYATQKIRQYLELGKRYSQTNFRYHLYIHTINTGLIIKKSHYQVYAFLDKSQFEFLLISREKYGKFKLNRAHKLNIMQGPLYGQLKNGYSFLMPDGVAINGNNFTNHNEIGSKISLLINKYHTRNALEIVQESKVLIYTLGK
uniref:Uncharacterized protein n=1 Tax=Eucheuma denticulatum TaxID=305493 RepID=A0A8E7PGC4_9FLOR|nr:hypothetical protein [Eucheuma denticulatum]